MRPSQLRMLREARARWHFERLGPRYSMRPSSSSQGHCIALLVLEPETYPFMNHLLNHDLFVGSPSAFSRCTACAYFSSVSRQMASASGLLDLKPASKPTNKVKGQNSSVAHFSSGLMGLPAQVVGGFWKSTSSASPCLHFADPGSLQGILRSRCVRRWSKTSRVGESLRLQLTVSGRHILGCCCWLF